MLSFILGIFIGVLAGNIGGPIAIKKATRRLGRYSILHTPKKHFMWTCIYVSPYFLIGVVILFVVLHFMPEGL